MSTSRRELFPHQIDNFSCFYDVVEFLSVKYPTSLARCVKDALKLNCLVLGIDCSVEVTDLEVRGIINLVIILIQEGVS